MTGHEHTIGEPVELAALYLAGAMTDQERAEFEAHLSAGCAACDREMLALDPLFAALGNSNDAVVPSAAARIAALARADEKLGELSPQQVEGVAALAAEVEKNLPELLQAAESWRPISIEGVLLRKLGIDHDERRITALVRMAPGSSLPRAHA